MINFNQKYLFSSQTKYLPSLKDSKLNFLVTSIKTEIEEWKIEPSKKSSDIEQSSTLSRPGRICLEPFSSLLASTVLLRSSPFRELALSSSLSLVS